MAVQIMFGASASYLFSNRYSRPRNVHPDPRPGAHNSSLETTAQSTNSAYWDHTNRYYFYPQSFSSGQQTLQACIYSLYLWSENRLPSFMPSMRNTFVRHAHAPPPPPPPPPPP